MSEATISANNAVAQPTTPSPAETLAQRNRADETRLTHTQERENLGSYAEAGIFYASKAPVANAVGGEVGIVTRDEKTGRTYRSGVGFYLRSDHISQVGYYGSVPF